MTELYKPTATTVTPATSSKVSLSTKVTLATQFHKVSKSVSKYVSNTQKNSMCSLVVSQSVCSSR